MYTVVVAVAVAAATVAAVSVTLLQFPSIHIYGHTPFAIHILCNIHILGFRIQSFARVFPSSNSSLHTPILWRHSLSLHHTLVLCSFCHTYKYIFSLSSAQVPISLLFYCLIRLTCLKQITWIDGLGNVLTTGIDYMKEPLPDSRRITAKSILKLTPKKEHHNTTFTCQAQNTADRTYRSAKLHLEVSVCNTFCRV